MEKIVLIQENLDKANSIKTSISSATMDVASLYNKVNEYKDAALSAFPFPINDSKEGRKYRVKVEKEGLNLFKNNANKPLDAVSSSYLDKLSATLRFAKQSLSLYGVTYDQSLVDNHILLDVRHLKEFFRAGDYKTKAVHDVSFSIKEGECFGLVGESGCGKTTTGRCVIGLYPPTSGAIYYRGFRLAAGSRWNEKEIKWSKIHTKEAIKELEQEMNNALSDANEEEYPSIKEHYQTLINEKKDYIKEHVAEQRALIKQIKYDNRHSNPRLRNEIQMIFQDPIDSLDPRMTVEDIITEGLHIQGSYNKEKNRKAVEEVLKKVGLIPEYASRYPHEFSGGQRQRIGIARALVMNPKLLICDEPISALDVSIRAQVLNLLNEIRNEMGLTMLFIAHDLSVVKYFCDRIAVMYFGNMVELASSDELFKHPLHPYTKALLSAIPKPDPLSEKARVRQVYNPATSHNYFEQKPSFREIVPGHFVLCNDEEEAKYKEEIAKLDKEAK